MIASSWLSQRFNSEAWLFFLIVLHIPSQLGLHFWPPFTVVAGLQIDYLSPTIYLTDIFLLLLFCLLLIKGQLRLLFLGISSHAQKLALLFCLVLFTGALSMDSGLFSYSLLRFFLYGFFTLYSVQQFRRNGIQIIVFPLLLGALFEIVLVYGQFFLQRSIGGVFYFFGERSFTLQTPGVAHVTLHGERILRPYGTFPHPNVLAAYFFLVSMFLGKYIFLQRHKRSLAVPVFFSMLVISGVVISFSRIAVLLFFLVIGIAIIGYFMRAKKKKNAYFLGMLFSVLLATIIFFFGDRFAYLSWNDQAIQERVALMQAAWSMVLQNPLFGQGISNFLPSLPFFERMLGQELFLQPVHSIYFLSLSEIGVVGFAFFVYFLFFLFQRVVQSPLKGFQRFFALSLFLSIGVFGFFDHYFFTLHQGRLLLCLSLGYLLSLVPARQKPVQ